MKQTETKPRPHVNSCHESRPATIEATRTVMLAGNPNCGKSTLFNALTGSHQHVGNWPGKTVEKKEGLWREDGAHVRVIDLPGSYSLTAGSLEEVIARDAILDSRGDLVVVVADASNLERNLYLVTQIIEMGAPVMLVLNMWDMAQADGIHINVPLLSSRLGIPVVPATLSTGAGLREVKQEVLKSFGRDGHVRREPLVRYSPALEQAIRDLEASLGAGGQQATWTCQRRWLALQRLEDQSGALRAEAGNAALLEAAASRSFDLAAVTGEDLEVQIAGERYGWINRVVHEAVHTSAAGPSATERIDRIVTHRWLGIPIFLLVMFMLFRLTSEIPAAYVTWLSSLLDGPLARWTSALLGLLGPQGAWLERLAVGGVLPGLGGVLAFVPVLMALYMGLGLLEDSGYMARAAFVIDRLMHTLGLHGKSFLPMLVGFGCSVPGIYATRTLESRSERILTGLLVPFMSCSARLPVYVLMAAIFFPRAAGTVIFGLYLGGFVMAILIGLLLNRTLLRGMPPAALIMELPAYHRPIWINIWRQTWERTAGFVRKAGTTILTCSMIVWLLMAIPARGPGSFTRTPVEDSLFGVLSQAAAPIFRPLGFGSWQMTGSLLTGIVAKEVVVSTMAQAYSSEQPQSAVAAGSLIEDVAEIGVGFAEATMNALRAIPLVVGVDLRADAPDERTDSGLMKSIRSGFTSTAVGEEALAALAFLVFVLLYTPCISALTVARHELGTKWMALSAVGQFVIAWLAGAFVFQVGALL